MNFISPQHPNDIRKKYKKWPIKHLTVVLDDSYSNKKLIQLITVVLLYGGQY